MADISSEFKSDLITINNVVQSHYFFNIPIYQRLYVWGQEQIHTLLEDIVQAFHEGKNEFYLGGTLVIERDSTKKENGESEYLFDLIDGQQRFTTLWLISVVLGEKLHDYKQVQTEQGIRPRIGFAIRPQVTEFFQRVCRGEGASLPEALQLEDALQEIRSFVSNYEDKNKHVLDTKKLSGFIRDKVQLILTRVPTNTDLNKLFEVINNRGVQLQHHEILKAKLLEVLPVDDRESHGQLWDACSDMSGYVERHLKAVTQVDTVNLYENKTTVEGQEREQLACASSVINQLVQKQQTEQKSALSLEDILKADSDFEVDSDVIDTDKDGSELPDRVNSIISFSMLLQHVLRIYLTRYADEFSHKDISKISDKDLINIFSNYYFNDSLTAENVRHYFKLLWQVRYLFDKHIIKWVMVEEEKVHAIRRPYVNRNKNKNTEYLQRLTTDAAPDFALLQSMLYHSQQMTTQYWLTPLLSFLISNNESDAALYLQHLDNHLLCSQVDAPLIERTQRYLVNTWHTERLLEPSQSLNQKFDNGTQYPHYWFYKLEYVLYLKLKSSSIRQDNQLIDDFRMTAKNSVEHVGPQNPRLPKDEVPPELLHRFGNLALVTRSLNSEMSDKGYGIKQAEFKSRYKGNGVSLKLEYIYKNDAWKKTEIDCHQQEMIKFFSEYLLNVEQQVNRKGIL
jgi:hypothetical protein